MFNFDGLQFCPLDGVFIIALKDEFYFQKIYEKFVKLCLYSIFVYLLFCQLIFSYLFTFIIYLFTISAICLHLSAVCLQL